MIALLLFAAGALPIPSADLQPQPLNTLKLRRLMLMCDSDDEKSGAIIDVRYDQRGNYLEIHQTRPVKADIRGPIVHGADKEFPDAYVLEISTAAQSDGSSATLQLQAKGGHTTGWFRRAGPHEMTGTCMSVPAPPDPPERGQ